MLFLFKKIRECTPYEWKHSTKQAQRSVALLLIDEWWEAAWPLASKNTFCERVSTDWAGPLQVFFFLHFLVAVFCCLQSATSLRDATESYNPTTFKFHFMETKATE